ncbi:MAG: glycosyltransferase family 2 protein [Planctomycetota bacterium]
MTAPTVSIVVPTYNRAGLLPRALDSIVRQTIDCWEIIVVDDGSSDETPNAVSPYAKSLGKRFTCLRQDNQGASSARNRGIDAARGDYVAFLDSDDEFLPDKLQRQLELFRKEPSLGFVYSDFAFVDLEGRRTDSVFRSKFPRALEAPTIEIAPRLHVCTGSLFDTLIRGYFIATIVGMVRRDVLGDCVRFAPMSSYAEEWLFYLQVARRCRAGFVDEPLSLHHFLAHSLTRESRRTNTLGKKKLLYTILDAFPDMTSAQRDGLRRQLAATLRQVGLDALRTDDPRSAALAFAKSFAASPNLAVFINGIEAGLRTLWPRRRAASS